ncbi:hypothetical protein BGX23_002507 [Mortierella sp. AD031]|nr:hypothetical protein BGX23_002507 [Mortierella sp. AD031]
MTDDLKRAAMDSMVRFVKEHARLFPGQLAGGATFIDGTFWENGSKVFPREVQLDIARCLPPLRDVTTVTDENWLRFEAHVKSMDLRTVENIVSRNKGIELLHGLDLDDGDERPFLQRCRGLKSLEMAARGPGSFKWAVEEKRRALYRLPGINTTPTTDSGVSDGKVTSPRTLALLQQGLVPLAKISLTENDTALTNECNDVTPPVNLPHLENLELIGWTALAFHPATLDSTPNLVTLRLEVGPKMGNLHNEVTYIPPVDELDRSFGIQNGGALAASSFQQEAPDDGQSIRPRWFWEWKLPHLTSLYLSAEFAFRFEFKMLYGCPALETLEIRGL